MRADAVRNRGVLLEVALDAFTHEKDVTLGAIAKQYGLTERGPTRPRMVTSWGDFVSWYGGIIDPAVSFMPFAARGFFDNGGQRLFAVPQRARKGP